MRRDVIARLGSFCAWVFLAFMSAAVVPRADGTQGPALSAVLVEAGSYVLRYQKTFAVIIGDERYSQHVTTGRSYRAERDREIQSEMMFLWLNKERTWLSVRNVLVVDGQTVNDSAHRLDRLLDGDAPIGVSRLRGLRDEGARFNLGSIRRNFNDPMFPLRFLEPENQPRLTFSLVGRQALNSIETTKVAFDENARPTFVQDEGRDLASRGMLWIAPDGAILRTRSEVEDSLHAANATIIVDYRRDPVLGVLVPSHMTETYRALNSMKSVIERIECEATYGPYHRFETSARIVPEH